MGSTLSSSSPVVVLGVTIGTNAPALSLDMLASAPALADRLPADALAALYQRTAVLEAALRARLLVLSCLPSPPTALSLPSRDEDRLLTAEEIATRLGTTISWVYAHANRFPFTRRLGRRTLRFSEAGLTRWLATRKC